MRCWEAVEGYGSVLDSSGTNLTAVWDGGFAMFEHTDDEWRCLSDVATLAVCPVGLTSVSGVFLEIVEGCIVYCQSGPQVVAK